MTYHTCICMCMCVHARARVCRYVIMTHYCLSCQKNSMGFVSVAEVPVILNYCIFLNNSTLSERCWLPSNCLGLEIAGAHFKSDFLKVKINK